MKKPPGATRRLEPLAVMTCPAYFVVSFCTDSDVK